MSSINNSTTTQDAFFEQQANLIIASLSHLPDDKRIDVIKKIFADLIPESSLNNICADKTKKTFAATQICTKTIEKLMLKDLQPTVETKTARQFLATLTPNQKNLFTIALGKALGSVKPLKAGQRYLDAYFNPSSKNPINRKIMHQVIQSEEGRKAVNSSSSYSYLKIFSCVSAVTAVVASIFFTASRLSPVAPLSTPATS